MSSITLKLVNLMKNSWNWLKKESTHLASFTNSCSLKAQDQRGEVNEEEDGRDRDDDGGVIIDDGIISGRYGANGDAHATEIAIRSEVDRSDVVRVNEQQHRWTGKRLEKHSVTEGRKDTWLTHLRLQEEENVPQNGMRWVHQGRLAWCWPIWTCAGRKNEPWVLDLGPSEVCNQVTLRISLIGKLCFP